MDLLKHPVFNDADKCLILFWKLSESYIKTRNDQDFKI